MGDGVRAGLPEQLRQAPQGTVRPLQGDDAPFHLLRGRGAPHDELHTAAVLAGQGRFRVAWGEEGRRAVHVRLDTDLRTLVSSATEGGVCAIYVCFVE
jgi:hypothetical protein